MVRLILISLALLIATPAVAVRDYKGDLVAKLANLDGKDIGTVTLRPVPGGTYIQASFFGLPMGIHALHIHETGSCDIPFTSAGGHYNPENVPHGFFSAENYHAGDLPNIHVPEAGALKLEIFAENLHLDSRLIDADGTAVLIHEGPDDYETQPSGSSGARIACGILKSGIVE